MHSPCCHYPIIYGQAPRTNILLLDAGNIHPLDPTPDTYKPQKELEQAIYSAHHQRRHASSATVLLLPNWTHTPYTKHLQNSKYVHKIMTVPARSVRATTIDLPSAPPANEKHINIYLVANSLALTDLTSSRIIPTLANAARSLYSSSTPVTLPPQGSSGGSGRDSYGGGLRFGRTQAVTRLYGDCDPVQTVRQDIEILMSDTRSVDKSRTRCGWNP